MLLKGKRIYNLKPLILSINSKPYSHMYMAFLDYLLRNVTLIRNFSIVSNTPPLLTLIKCRLLFYHYYYKCYKISINKAVISLLDFSSLPLPAMSLAG